MQKYILKSGKVIEFDYAPIDKALNLYQAVILASQGTGLDLTATEETMLSDLFNRNIDTWLAIRSSSAVIEAVKDCAIHCLYDKAKFDIERFEKDNRADLIPMLELVCMENLRPFMPKAHIFFDVVLSELIK